MSTALITGATRGIGRATAIALASRGWSVAITGRTQHEGDAAKRPEAEALPELKAVTGSLESTAEAIEAAGGKAVPLVLDLLDRESLQPTVERAIAELGHLDVYLGNAIYVGPAGEQRFLDTPPDELEKRIFGNVTAQVLLAQPVVRHMVERGSGTVAFTTSGAGYWKPRSAIGDGGWALSYGVSKAGLNRIAEQLVVEHPELRTCNLQPGGVATERVLAAGEKLAWVAEAGAPVDVIGEAFARILTAPPGTFRNGSTIEVQDVARLWGLL
jgi:NAD(P)-dependent dehydrogenase (short-subunit alcohol dehydrogenase family)